WALARHRARHDGQRRERQGDRQPRLEGDQAHRAGVLWRYALCGIRGAGEAGIEIAADPGHRHRAHPRVQSGRREGDGIRPQRADPEARPRRRRQGLNLYIDLTNSRQRKRPMSALAHDTAQAPQTLSEELAQFALGLTYEQIPAAIVARAKYLILDSVGIALASTQYPFASVSFAAM